MVHWRKLNVRDTSFAMQIEATRPDPTLNVHKEADVFGFYIQLQWQFERIILDDLDQNQGRSDMARKLL